MSVDRDRRTSVSAVYAVGWTIQGESVRTTISVREGAAAALDILARAYDRTIRDFDAAADEVGR